MAIRKLFFILAFSCLSGCLSMDFQRDSISNVFVEDFESTEKNCNASDVNVTHTAARKFFQSRATMMTKRQIDLYYPYVVCYAMGSLEYWGERCDWEIYASGTGNIKCGEYTWYFACDDCEDLLNKHPKPCICTCASQTNRP